MTERNKILDNLILEALEDTYIFNRWEFKNEAEFKHELYHNLGKKKFENKYLIEPVSKYNTSIIHSESKAENGKYGPKADILLCDPNKTNHQTFNYKVSHIIELKLKFTKSDLIKEQKKLDRYKEKYDTVIFASGLSNDNIESGEYLKHNATNKIIVVKPNKSTERKQNLSFTFFKNLDRIYEIIDKCINKSLLAYGTNKKQFKSFFWCNYEGEINRGHSYPSEGDFNAFLYSELRTNLPEGIIIRSEFKPVNSSYRIDFLITDSFNSFAIPIEVKMNWDQFKEKHSEVERIMTRFQQLERDVLPIIIVIQGEWRIKNRNRKEKSIKELTNSDLNFYFYSYNEIKEKCEKIRY